MKTFEKLKYQQIKALLDVANDTKEKDLDVVMNRHKSISDNFNGAKDFLHDLNVLNVKGGKVYLKKEFEGTMNTRLSDIILKGRLLDELLTRKSIHSKEILSYLDKFKVVRNKFEYKPNTASRVKESAVRNLFMELGLIEYNRSFGIYRISERHFGSFEVYLNHKKLSPKELKLILKHKDELGKAAELEVLQYEKKRLIEYPELIEQIEHTAIKDVMAGYDILSWETVYHSSKIAPRYIEVKAVSKNDSNFYWTRNEIEMAKKLAEKYYLYLLPTIGDKQFDLGALEIIPDPMAKVFYNSKQWNKQVETYLFFQRT